MESVVEIDALSEISSASSNSPSEYHDRIIQILLGPSQNIKFHDPYKLLKHLHAHADKPFNKTSILHLSHIPMVKLDLSTRRFGSYGGRYAPELQMEALSDLANHFRDAISDIAFWKQFLDCGIVKTTPLIQAKNLTEEAGGAKIWLKREDLGPRASHKVRTILGQILLAARIGKTEIVMDCAFAGHGLVCADICSKLGLNCTIFMGDADGTAQSDEVDAMRALGAAVILSDNGLGCTGIRAALDDAHRHAMAHFADAYYIPSGPIGPHPYPLIHRFFQALLGEEVKDQCLGVMGKGAPDGIVVSVGMGSGAVGMFAPFIENLNPAVKLVGVHADDSAPLTSGSVGVLYGACTYLLQDEHGQIQDGNSQAADLSSHLVGPELAHWKHAPCVEFVEATSHDECVGASRLRHLEGLDALYPASYAVEETMKLAKELGPGKDVVLLVSGG